MKTRRQYTRDFKIAIVREIETGKSLARVSRENEFLKKALRTLESRIQEERIMAVRE